MPTTSVPPALRADKALTRQVAAFDDAVENAEDFIELMKSASAQASLRKDVAAIRQRMKAALEGKEPARDAAKLVSGLGNEAKQLADRASGAMVREIQDRYTASWTQARGLLAQALLEVGAIEPPPLRLPMQKEQADLRAKLDRIEKEPIKGLSSITDLQALLPQIEAFMKRLAATAAQGQSLRAGYFPAMARARAAIQRVPAERCRKTLLAEVDFVEADVTQTLGRADVKVVQGRALPRLQRIEKLAVEVTAAAPALDRELARLAKALHGAGAAQPGLMKRLKSMIQARATTWPAGADLEAMAAALATYESDLRKLTSEVDPIARAAAKA